MELKRGSENGEFEVLQGILCRELLDAVYIATEYLWDTAGAQWDTHMTLPMCVHVHILSVHPAEEFSHSTQVTNSFSQMGV